MSSRPTINNWEEWAQLSLTAGCVQTLERPHCVRRPLPNAVTCTTVRVMQAVAQHPRLGISLERTQISLDELPQHFGEAVNLLLAEALESLCSMCIRDMPAILGFRLALFSQSVSSAMFRYQTAV